MRVRFRTRAWRLFLWGLLLFVCSLAGGLSWAYSHYTNSDTLARLIKEQAPRYLPGGLLDIGHVQAKVLAGTIQIRNIMLRQQIEGKGFMVLRIPWLKVQYDPEAMLDGRFAPTEVVVAQPTLRLCRRQDGTWNLQGLLASPWPNTHMKVMPTILIQNGTVELADNPASTEQGAILRDVAVKLVPAEKHQIKFEGTAKGGSVDRISLEGTIDRGTGAVALSGDLARLVISESLRKRLPPEVSPGMAALGLTGGEADVQVHRLNFTPGARPAITYDASAQLRAGLWTCDKLPFPIHDLSASMTARDGVLTIERAEGDNGQTRVFAEGQVALGDPKMSPLDIRINLKDLELDERLRKWTPPQQMKLWEDFQPAGRVTVDIHVKRQNYGAQPELIVGVDCHDVSVCYRFFQYPLHHISGHFDWSRKRVDLDLKSAVDGGQPIFAKGVILDPGPGTSRVDIVFSTQEMPVNATLRNAFPPDVRKVIEEFRPSGSVRGSARVKRLPPTSPNEDPKGKVTVEAELDLNERCSIQWVNLPYPVENLTGRLILKPNRWEFQGMQGTHGQAKITGRGLVEKIGGRQKIDLHLKGERLLFDGELRTSLPRAWQITWERLNPSGSSDVDATIKIEPGMPEDYHLVITPGPSTSVELKYSREPRPGIDPGGQFTLPMDDVRGQFVYHNGLVTMKDVNFKFYSAPVQFATGTVRVENSGRFDLRVSELRAREIRLGSELRKIMPPVMAQFARRLDDGRTFTIKGNLALGWSGQPRAPVMCRWNNGLVVFNGNTIQAGVPLTFLQGQLDSVSGSADGDNLEVAGMLHLESVTLLGQQVSKLESPLEVGKGWAKLDNISGYLLGGMLSGRIAVSLDATPKYFAGLSIRNADLQRYTRTIHGKQRFRGLVDARVDVEGLGTDLHNLQGSGEAHVTQGDLGELPFFLRLFKILNLSPATKTAFDSADVNFTIQNGESYLDPIKFTGDALSLMGRGTLDVQGSLDLRLRVLYGRDRLQLRLLSDAMREASGQLVIVRVLGTPSYPKPTVEPLPTLTDFGKTLVNGRPPLLEREPR
jgi:hypothetical protein